MIVPRTCPACAELHPPTTTCAGGWNPWDGETMPVSAPAGTKVVLTDAQVARVEAWAAKVVETNNSRGRRCMFDAGHEGQLGVSYRGFAAELAASIATGMELKWKMLPAKYRRRDKPPDLGRRTEVRNALRPTGWLWAHPSDRTDWVYLLVTGSRRHYRVVGWLEGRELINERNWREPPAVIYQGYSVPQTELHPLPLPADA